MVYNDSLTREDEKAVLAQLPGVYSSPVMEMHDRISFGGGVVKDTLVLGVSPQYLHIRNLLVPVGRFFDETDDAAHIKCAVVSELFARDRFGSADAAVGQSFEISGIPFTIIGVFKESVDDFGESEIADQTILIPYSVARYFTGTENVKQIYFSMRTMDEVPDAAKEIERIVQRAPPAQLGLQGANAEGTADDGRQDRQRADRWCWWLVAAVTLAVGGVGIMNIMLANVRARIREIGIRKALGATYREIKLPVSGRGRHHLADRAALWARWWGWPCRSPSASSPTIQLPVSGWSVVIALTAATVVGVIFGTVPATRAAQMDPVESLKYE